jgi:hypothetical protein
MSKIHFRPVRAFSWPSGGRKRPQLRTFLLANNIVCPAQDREAVSSADDKKVTCERCLSIFLKGRYDSDAVVDEVLSRGRS